MRVIDLETRSLSDLPKEGGHKYALHPTTELLTVSWSDDGSEMHVWIPGVDEVSPHLIDLHLPGVRIHLGSDLPPELLEVDDVWVGHNAWGFDQPVWEEVLRRRGVYAFPRWDDSACLALQAGLPGKLNQIGVRLWGEGKYEEGASALKSASREAHDPPVGTLALIAKYNVQDVRLTWNLMVHLQDFPVTPAERSVMRVHRSINDRGVRIDSALVTSLMRLSNQAVDHAVTEIDRITNGRLKSAKDLRSKTVMVKWLDDMGADVGKGKRNKEGKPISRTLAKAIVKEWIDAKSLDEDDDTVEREDGEGEGESSASLMDVVRVLQLREAALRVTAGKLTAAGVGCGDDGYLRGLHAYYAAHTGRFAGRRLQTQNLPRPKEGCDFWGLIRLWIASGRTGFSIGQVNALAEATLHQVQQKAGGTSKCALASLDDSASALIRGILLPNRGELLLAADLAAIEARLLGWLGPEKWMMDAFWGKKDAYTEFCYKTTGKRIGKKDPERQLWKVILLGCGYGMGGDGMALYAAANGIDLRAYGLTGQGAVDAYRDACPAIAGDVMGTINDRKWRRNGLWNDYMEAAVAAAGGLSVRSHRCGFIKKKGNLHITLPSGRDIVYRNIVLGTASVFGKARPTLTYSSPRFADTKLWHGSLCENIDQAVARDVNCNGMVRVEDAGMPVILHVHDEVVASGPGTRLPDFMREFTTPPDWLTDFPLDAEGSTSPRYCKSPPPGVRDVTWRNGSPL